MFLLDRSVQFLVLSLELKSCAKTYLAMTLTHVLKHSGGVSLRATIFTFLRSGYENPGFPSPCLSSDTQNTEPNVDSLLQKETGFSTFEKESSVLIYILFL